MDVRLSAEQRALRESAEVLVDRLRPQSVRDLDDRERAQKLDAAVASSGWRELRTASDEGGPWASAVEVAIVAEELGRGPVDASFVGPTLAAELRRLAAAPTATSGETVVLRGDLSEPAVGSADFITGDAVTGVAIDAAGSSRALHLVRGAGGYSLAEASLDAQPAGGVDLTRAFQAANVPAQPDPLAGQQRPVTDEDLARWTALGLALTAADLVGAMRGAIQLACDYAGTRRQFGAPIGAFQAVQHLLADAFVAMEGSRSVTLHAAWAVDALPADEALAAAAVAKAYSARAARTTCETVIQVHGGIGNTWECFAHVYLRRVLASCDLLGGVGPSLARLLDHHQIGGGRGLP
jgi:alkylation response protein AidB-like acyl-CoA dehydrogenase